MSARILVVEDEEALTTLLRYNLDAEGYDVETVAVATMQIRGSRSMFPISSCSTGCFPVCPESSFAAGCAHDPRPSRSRSSC